MGFTPTVLREIDFTDEEGEQHKILVEFRRLKRKEGLALSPYIPKPDENGNVKMTLQENSELLDKVAELMPEIVLSIEGYKVGEGDGAREITIQDVTEELYFMEILSGIFKEVMEASFIQKADAKN